MAYIKTVWVNDSTPSIDAANLNNIEDGIFDTTNDFDAHTTVSASLTVLGHVQNGTYTATITTASWTGSTAPFTSSQTITGILETDIPIIDILMTGVFATDQAILEQWVYVYSAETTTSAVIFSATEKPSVELPIQLKVVR